MVVKQLVAVVAAVIVGTADRPFGDPFWPFWASGGTKRVARAASRPKLHGQARPGRFHESVGKGGTKRVGRSVVVKQLVAVVAAVIVGTADRPFHDPFWPFWASGGTKRVRRSGRFHESVVVKQLVAVVAAVIVGTADRPFGDPFWPFWTSGGTKRVARAASRPKLHGQARPGRFHESVGKGGTKRVGRSVVVKQLVAVVAAVIVGTADRPFHDPFWPFWASGGTKRVARAASRPKLHGQARPGRFHESVGKGGTNRVGRSVVVKQLVAVVAAVIVGTADRPFHDPFWPFWASGGTKRVARAASRPKLHGQARPGRFHESVGKGGTNRVGRSVVVKQLVAVVAAVIVGTADRPFHDPFWPFWASGGTKRVARAASRPKLHGQARPGRFHESVGKGGTKRVGRSVVVKQLVAVVAAVIVGTADRPFHDPFWPFWASGGTKRVARAASRPKLHGQARPGRFHESVGKGGTNRVGRSVVVKQLVAVVAAVIVGTADRPFHDPFWPFWASGGTKRVARAASRPKLHGQARPGRFHESVGKGGTNRVGRSVVVKQLVAVVAAVIVGTADRPFHDPFWPFWASGGTKRVARAASRPKLHGQARPGRFHESVGKGGTNRVGRSVVVKQLVAVVAAVIVGTADRPFHDPFWPFWASGGTKRVARAASRPKLHGQARPGRFHESVGRGTNRVGRSVVVKQLVAVVAAVIVGTADRPFHDPFWPFWASGGTKRVARAASRPKLHGQARPGRFHESVGKGGTNRVGRSVVVKQLVAVVAAVIVGTADRPFHDPFWPFWASGGTKRVARAASRPKLHGQARPGRFHESVGKGGTNRVGRSVVVKQLVAVVAAVIVGTADKLFGNSSIVAL